MWWEPHAPRGPRDLLEEHIPVLPSPAGSWPCHQWWDAGSPNACRGKSPLFPLLLLLGGVRLQLLALVFLILLVSFRERKTLLLFPSLESEYWTYSDKAIPQVTLISGHFFFLLVFSFGWGEDAILLLGERAKHRSLPTLVYASPKLLCQRWIRTVEEFAHSM